MASPELQQLVRDPPEWATQVGTDLASRLAEGPGWSAFARSDGVVYHTFSRHAPDGNLLSPYYYELLEQVPKAARR